MPQPSSGPRLSRLFGLAAWGTLAVVLVLLGPDLWRFLPPPIRVRPVQFALLGGVIGYQALRWFGNRRRRRGPRLTSARRARLAVDRLTAWAYPGRTGLVLGVVLAGLVAAWVPHYLTWPWCRDEDAFAMTAMSWDRGILPYRDIRVYNFPGHIYLHWVLGKLVGWGHPSVFYAIDSATVIALGVALIAWSRRVLGLALPGLVGFAGFLWFYLGLEFELVAERDWHASFLAALGLLAAEAWPGWRGRTASAVALALAFAIRPHAVLFLPAMVSATLEDRGPSGGPAARRLAAWGATFSAALAVAFAPILFAGLVDDLAVRLRIAAYGGPYSRATLGSALAVFGEQLASPWTSGILLSCAAMGVAGPTAWRGPARTWGLALLGALVYRPLHPVQHAYLAHPREVFQSIALALPVAWLATTPRLARPVRLLTVLIVLCEALPGVPRFSLPMESLGALRSLARGEGVPQAPPGSFRFFHRGEPCQDPYCWRDYLAALDEVRRRTGPGTEVANVLRRIPFPSVNGPTGRLSPFLAESGICWMWLVNEDLDAEFAASLERSVDSVVVWDPSAPNPEPRLRLPRLTDTIRRLYRPEARFGSIEIWRRIPAASPGGVPRP
jgi:hypothetical protein